MKRRPLMRSLVFATATAGLAMPAFADDRLLGFPRADVEQIFSDLPADRLDQLVFRIPNFSQIMAEAKQSSAAAINPYGLLDQTREQLAQRFPSLSDEQLDLLQFKIADINSMRSATR